MIARRAIATSVVHAAVVLGAATVVATYAPRDGSPVSVVAYALVVMLAIYSMLRLQALRVDLGWRKVSTTPVWFAKRHDPRG